MTLLYETGRWRRYFTEEQFLSIIRETRDAADRWHRLAPDTEPMVRLVPEAGPAFGRSEPPPLPSLLASPPSSIERSVA